MIFGVDRKGGFLKNLRQAIDCIERKINRVAAVKKMRCFALVGLVVDSESGLIIE